jgi:glycosyltransferase involved in cell wall biosynthesis
VIPGETGLLVPPRAPAALAEAIETLAAAPELCARLGAAAKHRADALFVLDACVRPYVRLYKGTSNARWRCSRSSTRPEAEAKMQGI